MMLLVVSRFTIATALGLCLSAAVAASSQTACTDSLARLCDSARRASAGDCLVCCGQHQPQLQQANCNSPAIDAFCSGIATADPWPMFMRTPSHDASAAAATATPPAANLKAAWVYNMSHVVSSSPTLIGDVVLAASGCGPHPCAGGGIAALYRSSGAVKVS